MTDETKTALLSKLRAPVADDAKGQIEYLDMDNHRLRRALQKLMARLADLLDEDQFANCESIVTAAGVAPPESKPIVDELNSVKANASPVHPGFHSAPVAGEARPDHQAVIEAIHRYGNARAMAEHNIAYRDEVRNTYDALVALFNAAPQASEAVRDAEDAARWRAFTGCARIRPLGSAGLEQPDPNHYAHMGLEIWTVYGRDYSPELLKKMDDENERGRRWLVMFADVARAALSAQPGAQRTGGGDAG